MPASPDRDAPGAVVVADRVADLHVLMSDRVVLLHQRVRPLVVNILALPPDRLVRLRHYPDRLVAASGAG